MNEFSNGENIIDYINQLSSVEDSLIVLDEPETSLSLESQIKIREKLIEISKKNQLIIITHSPVIMSLSDKIYDFNKKKYISTKDHLKYFSLVINSLK